MQNFVFKTRNPEYVWHLVAVLIVISLIPTFFYSWEYLGFIIFYGLYVLLLIGGLLSIFIATTTIEMSNNEVIITKYILGINNYSYKQLFEYYHIENQLIIHFVGHHSAPLKFELIEDFEIDSYFAVYIHKQEIMLGNEKSFTKFKESLEKWNKQL
jgi:hypothetical protein